MSIGEEKEAEAEAEEEVEVNKIISNFFGDMQNFAAKDLKQNKTAQVIS